MNKLSHHLRRSQNIVLWGISVACGCIIIYLLFSINIKTGKAVANTEGTVVHIDKQLDSLQKNIEIDHQRQDANQARILDCLGSLFIEHTTATKEQVMECTSVSEQDMGIAPSSQRDSPEQSSDMASGASSPHNTPESNNSQQENPQSPEPKPKSLLFEDCTVQISILGWCL